jgi:hypothetical protein
MFAGPGARRALLDGSAGVVELMLSGGAYVRLGSSEWLLLTGPDAPFGPLSLVVDRLDRLELQPGAPAHVAGTKLVLADRALSCERVRVRCATVARRSHAQTGAIAAAADAALAEIRRPPSSLSGGIAELASRREVDAVRSLAGLGEGLTPAGDDVLAGFAAGRLALSLPLAPGPALSMLAAGRSSALGLAYLRCAERGELPDAAARLLDAICRGSAAAARAAVSALRSWGASSGAALALGIDAAVMQSSERSYRWQDSGWGSTCSRTLRSSISPRPTASGRWRGGMTQSSTRF